jgi:hypothetical protein
MPDAERGYYRATRFDWSGVVADLQAGGHSYFGRWNPKYDPKLHDAISGPVQEFVTGQGFDDAKPGETFVKIGVGVLRKPAEAARGFATLEIVDGGKWSTKVNKDSVEFIHEVNDPVSGYGYRYTKTVALSPGKTQMTLTHHLESTGAKPIDTEMYNHNFFVLDGQPSGPDVEVRVPFKLEAFNVRGDAIQVGSDRPISRHRDRQRMQPVALAWPTDLTSASRIARGGRAVRSSVRHIFWTSPRTTS